MDNGFINDDFKVKGSLDVDVNTNIGGDTDIGGDLDVVGAFSSASSTFNVAAAGTTAVALKQGGVSASGFFPIIMDVTDTYQTIGAGANRGAWFIIVSSSGDDQPNYVCVATCSSNANAGTVTTIVSKVGVGVWAGNAFQIQWGAASVPQIKHDKAATTASNVRILMIGI